MLYLSILPALLLSWGIYELIDSNSDEDDNSVTGTAEADDIDTKGGNDVVRGFGGDDNIEGGSGNDLLGGGDDDDVVLGQQGNDTISGGEGDDLLIAGRGDDEVVGSFGDDWVEGNEGDDTLGGDAGADLLIGGRGADEIAGGDDDDTLVGGIVAGTPLSFEDLKLLRDGTSLAELLDATDDTALTLRDDGDADSLFGGAGDDVLFLGAGDAGTGGEGIDTFVIMEKQADRDAEGDLDPGPATVTALEDGETIGILSGDATDPEVTVTTDGDDALVSIDDVVLARVLGAGSTLTADDVVIIAAPTVGAVDPAA